MKLIPFVEGSTSPAHLEMEAQLDVDSKAWILSFALTGAAVDQVSLTPPSSKPGRKNELWKETCFECFFGVAGTEQYFEFNGSPSGDWALYAFDGYRKGVRDAPVSASPELLKMEKTADTLLCVWRIPYFTDLILQKAGITAVVKDEKGNVSYWALKHAGEKPDFHLRESFVHRFV